MRGLLVPGSQLRQRLRRALPFLVPVLRAWREAPETVRGRIAFWREDKPDREVLEGMVFPGLRQRPDVRRILFVGVDWYTRRYRRAFPGRELWTIEVIPQRAKHGVKGRHVVGSVVELDAHFEPRSFDAVILNGVLGYGLDDTAGQATAIAQCARALRPGGLLVVGWNDIEPQRPAVPVSEMAADAGLEPTVLEPFAAARHPTFGDARMTYEFFARPT